MRARPFSHANRRAGSVLIVTMWVCLGLVSVALIFGHTAYMSYRASGNDLAARQADQAIEGGLRYAEYVLASVATPGAFPSVTYYQSEAVPVGDATFWFLGRGEDSDNGAIRNYGLVDEASKLNLNTATQTQLELLPGMTSDFATAIIQWRAGSASGATTGTDAKGGVFESEAELALVDGADPLTLMGEDTNFNGVLDDNENDGAKSDPPDNSDGKLDAGILEYVTAFSREPKTRADGTSNRFVIAPGITQPVLDAIKAAYPAVSLGNVRAGVACTSPLDFYLQSGMTPTDFDLIANDLTVGKYDGLVNVNTARATVLSCLDGLDVTKAAALVTARQARTPGDSSLSWVKDVLDPATIKQVGPFLTGQSYQVSADIAAVGQNGRGYRRTRFVVDNITGTPRVIYRRNLSGFGWALGQDARQLLTARYPR